jgi:hypothetical protein
MHTLYQQGIFDLSPNHAAVRAVSNSMNRQALSNDHRFFIFFCKVLSSPFCSVNSFYGFEFTENEEKVVSINDTLS